MELSKCLGCMEDFRGYPCPNCGYDPGQGQKNTFSLPPQTILYGKYLVGRVLGQGGFGITYIGWDIALERKVAIKEYYPSGQVSRVPGTKSLIWSESDPAVAARQDGLEMFLKEARKMSKVDDIPGVVRVRDLFRENDTAYIVMDFVEGETLKARLKRTGPMSWDQAKEIFQPAIRAMEQVHKAGLIHRDLSPDNIMLLPDGSVKILDLGAAKDLNVNQGASSMQVAKGGFSPYEQYSQRGGSGPWTDVYAMAATIYFTLTGKIPPIAIDRAEDDTISWNLPRLDTLPRQALEALKKAMAVPAKKRTQSMEELEKGLFVEEVEPEPKPESKPEPEVKPEPEFVPKPTPEKKPKKVVLAAVAAVAVVLSGIVYGTVLKPANAYKQAQALLDAGKYEEAEAAFAALGDYKDSAQNVQLLPAYRQALASMDAEEYEEAATAFEALGDYLDSPAQAKAAREMRQIVQISAGADHTLGLRRDGTVVAVGDNEDGQCEVDDWKDIVAIEAGSVHSLGLRSDGTVIAIGYTGTDRCEVNDWKDITSISALSGHSVGLQSDGTVAFAGQWVYHSVDLSNWKDIIAIAAGADFDIGLRRDGTVIVGGHNSYGVDDADDWTDIVAVAAGYYHAVGLRSDGTVVAVGDNDDGQCNVSGWSDIVAVSAGDEHTVGLRSDGTVVAAGYNEYGQCDVSDWTDIVAVSAGYSHTVGLRSDGTVVAVGRNDHGECDVSSWSNILTP